MLMFAPETARKGTKASPSTHAGRSRATVQRKALVGAPGDAHEREADSVADAVMGMRAPEPATLAPKGIQKKCARCEDEGDVRVQAMRAPGASSETSVDAEDVERATAHGGAPLQREVRDFFESRFRQDFESVRIHDDARAAASAQALDARAYTSGRHIVFARGAYAPHTSEGKRLLAHELAHVRQQASSPGTPLVQREPDKDHCGPIRGIAFTYRVALQEGRLADAEKLLTGASKEDATYLLCRINTPGDELAKFAQARIQEKGVAAASDQLKRKMGLIKDPPPEEAPAAPPKSPMFWSTFKGYDQFVAEVQQDVAKNPGAFRVEGDDDWIDYRYVPAYKQVAGGWSKWVVFIYPDGTSKEVNLDDISPTMPNQYRVKRRIEKIMSEDFDQIFSMSVNASMFVISAGQALSNPLGTPWAVRGAPGVARIPGLRGNVYDAPGGVGAANDVTPGPVGAAEPPTNVVPLIRPSQPRYYGTLALDPMFEQLGLAPPAQDAAPLPLWRPAPVPEPLAFDVPLTPSRFFQAPGPQVNAPIQITPFGAFSMTPVAAGPKPGAAGGAPEPVMPQGLSREKKELWKKCKGLHDSYKNTQAEYANLVKQIEPLEQAVKQNRATPEERLKFCAALHERMDKAERLKTERKSYIDKDCDQFDWFNTGTTEAERKERHMDEWGNVQASMGNLQGLFHKYCS